MRWVAGGVACALLCAVAALAAWWTRQGPTQGRPADKTASEFSSSELQRVSADRGAVPVTSGTAWTAVDNPASDGWTTEVFSERAGKALNQLGELLTRSDVIEEGRLEALLGSGFSCDALLPQPLDTVFQDHVFRVQRPKDLGVSTAEEPGGPYRGAEGLAQALSALAAPLKGATDVRFKFKIFRAEPSGSGFVTRQYFALSGRTAEGILEQNATWTAYWGPSPGEKDLPKLLRIGLEAFEQVTTRNPSGPLFVDCTESVVGSNQSYRQQLLLGLNHWLERIQDTRYFTPLGNPGLALGDVNGDGLEDLYVCQETNLPNLLYLQRADGTVEDVSAAWGVNFLESSRSALLVDLDNDGDQDLVVAMLGSVVVCANDRQERFEVRSVLPTDDDTMSLTAADYDNDGDLDLYVCVDYPNDDFSKSRDISVIGGDSNRVYHDANNAGRDSLLRNDISPQGEWRFTDVTQETGMDVNNRRFSLAASWDDFDNDGDQDLYVANDFGRNNLYRNDAVQTGTAHFVDIAKEAGADDPASGMSVSWSDYDRDGNMDVYVGNMFSSAGGRITFQPQFKADATPEIKARLQGFSRGSTLLKNLGNGTFRDVSVDAAVTMGRWAWSSNFVDINNDGWDDLVVANGYITTEDTGDL